MTFVAFLTDSDACACRSVKFWFIKMFFFNRESSQKDSLLSSKIHLILFCIHKLSDHSWINNFLFVAAFNVFLQRALVLFLVLKMKLIQFFIFLLAQAMAKDDELAQAVQGKSFDTLKKVLSVFKDAEMFLTKMGRTFYGINRRNLPFSESQNAKRAFKSDFQPF